MTNTLPLIAGWAIGFLLFFFGAPPILTILAAPIAVILTKEYLEW